MKQAVGGLIVYLSFGIFATVYCHALRIAGGWKGTVLTDIGRGFGMTSIIGGTMAAVFYGLYLMGAIR